MDRRIVKTKRRIRDAFLALRRRYSDDKIKVKDICAEAKINKTTFYKHYEDSEELSEEIDEALAEGVVSSFCERESLFDYPEQYVEGLTEAIERETNELEVVYRGRREILCAKLEEKLRKIYDYNEAHAERRVISSFIIGGVLRVLIDRIFTNKNDRCDKKTLLNSLIKMVRRVIPAT